MIYAEAVLLSGLLFFGGYCSFTDFKKGIVPNRVIIIGLLAGLAVHGALLLCGAAEYYPSWLLIMAISDAFALGMFFGKMWAAGDAKLFMLLFFLTPPRIFDSGALAQSVVPYIFIFVPALFWMAIDTIIRLIKKEERKHQRFSLKSLLLNYLCIIIETTALHSILSWLVPALIGQQPLLTAVLMLMYAYVCGSIRAMKRWYVILIHVTVIVVLWALKKWSFSVPPWENYLIILSVIIFQRFCSMYNYQLICTADVSKGMVLAMETILLFQTSRVHSLPSDPSEDLTARITEEEAQAVRRWEKSATGESKIWIVRKVPFAIMIYIGFVGWIGLRLLGR